MPTDKISARYLLQVFTLYLSSSISAHSVGRGGLVVPLRLHGDIDGAGRQEAAAGAHDGAVRRRAVLREPLPAMVQTYS